MEFTLAGLGVHRRKGPSRPVVDRVIGLFACGNRCSKLGADVFRRCQPTCMRGASILTRAKASVAGVMRGLAIISHRRQTNRSCEQLRQRNSA